MKFLEKDLEQIIYDTDNSLLCSRGLYISGKKLRQTRIGNYGISDLITVRKEYEYEPFLDDEEKKITYKASPYLVITIYELKKDEINLNTYHQSLKYVKGIQSYLSKRGFNQDVQFIITLVGKSICIKSSFPYLADIKSGVNIYSYDYYFDGIKFKKEGGYVLTDEGF